MVLISHREALEKVCAQARDFGTETVELLDSVGRVLAEPIYADRDFPPFDRSTKDGIAIAFSAITEGIRRFPIAGILAAGTPRDTLKDARHCLEIMTGAVIPHHADTVIMYEDVDIHGGYAELRTVPKHGQNIHKQGSDAPKGTLLIASGLPINAAMVNILATVGHARVEVLKRPRAAVIATGNELVEVGERPLPHQIRKSNALALQAALEKEGIPVFPCHVRDEPPEIRTTLEQALDTCEVLLLSGGVSKGKYDHIPEILQELGVVQIFHGVAQRPGKPFWFGSRPDDGTVVFSFPGNPVSTFAGYVQYFIPWLQRSQGLRDRELEVVLDGSVRPLPKLTRFVQASLEERQGICYARPILDNGSGDLTGLVRADGFVCVPPGEKEIPSGERLPYRPFS